VRQPRGVTVKAEPLVGLVRVNPSNRVQELFSERRVYQDPRLVCHAGLEAHLVPRVQKPLQDVG